MGNINNRLTGWGGGKHRYFAVAFVSLVTASYFWHFYLNSFNPKSLFLISTFSGQCDVQLLNDHQELGSFLW